MSESPEGVELTGLAFTSPHSAETCRQPVLTRLRLLSPLPAPAHGARREGAREPWALRERPSSGGQGSVWEAFAPPSSPPSWPPSRQHAAARKSPRSPRSCRVGGSGLSRLFSVPVSPQPEDPSGRRLGCSGPPVDPQPAGSPWAHSGWTDPPGAHVPREEQVLNVPEPSMAGSALPRPAPPAPAHRDLLKPGVCPGHAGLAAATSLSDGSCWPPKKPETATTLLATPLPGTALSARCQVWGPSPWPLVSWLEARF